MSEDRTKKCHWWSCKRLDTELHRIAGDHMHPRNVHYCPDHAKAARDKGLTVVALDALRPAQ